MKNNIFVILSKMDFKYIKRRRISQLQSQIVSSTLANFAQKTL